MQQHRGLVSDLCSIIAPKKKKKKLIGIRRLTRRFIVNGATATNKHCCATRHGLDHLHPNFQWARASALLFNAYGLHYGSSRQSAINFPYCIHARKHAFSLLRSAKHVLHPADWLTLARSCNNRQHNPTQSARLPACSLPLAVELRHECAEMLHSSGSGVEQRARAAARGRKQ